MTDQTTKQQAHDEATCSCDHAHTKDNESKAGSSCSIDGCKCGNKDKVKDASQCDCC